MGLDMLSCITHNLKNDGMNSIPRKIYYYETDDGRCPFIEWRDSVKDQVFQEAWQNRLIRIRLGNFGKCNTVREGVQELKFFVGPGYRVYFAEWGKTIVVLLCGGDKTTQGRKDIELAKQYWNDFRRSNQ